MQRLSPIRLAVLEVPLQRERFSLQFKMGELSPQANESTTVFLFRVRSVSGAVLTAWTDKLAGFHQEQGKGVEKHVDSSSKRYTQPISLNKRSHHVT